MEQHVVTYQRDGYIDVVGPFRSEQRARAYRDMRATGDDRAFVEVRPLLKLSRETQQDLQRWPT